MQFKVLFMSALAAVGTAMKPRCGTTSPTEEQLQTARNLQVIEPQMSLAESSTQIANTSIQVKVYWHVVATSNSTSGGYLTNATLDRQLQVLNRAYAPHNISFTQAGADWTISSEYANSGDLDRTVMKRALRKGTYADLNVYFVPEYEVLGKGEFPTYVTTGSADFYLDGVIVDSSTVPGGSAVDFNLGHTATHEVGHWFYLFHTFQGRCFGGDSVADTPAEARPAFGCPTTRNTCIQPGLDPVTNYMDYSDDICFTHFTKGQAARMRSAWKQFRAAAST